MKNKLPTLITLVAGLSAITIIAQDAPPPRRERPPGGPDRGEFRPEGGRFRPPLLAVLDTNDDGVIDEKEIEQAPQSLRKLDKNHDGKITMDELRPPRPEGAGGPDRPGRPQRPERAPEKQ
jgi:hypothetical protein